MRFTLWAFLASVFFAAPAIAGVHIEPWIGIAPSGEAENATTTEDYSGRGLGLRGGYSFLGLGVGAEYAQYNMSWDRPTEVDVTSRDVSAYAMYEFPILLRAYAAYILYSAGDYETNSKLDLEEGSGTKLGVGYTGLPFLSLNLEWVRQEYDKLDGASTDFKTDFYIVTVSLPLP